jgi:hypothetical protein
MISRIFLFASLFLLSLNVNAGAASIEFEEILSFSVPDAGIIEKIEFGDIDFNGHPECLISDGTQAIIYSHFLDTIFYSAALELPDLVCGEGLYEILFSDINRDAVPDFSVGIYHSHIKTLNIEYVGGTTFWGLVDTFTTEIGVGEFFPCPLGLTLFEAIDFDLDGYCELIFSCDSSFGYFWGGAITSYLSGLTRIYYSFPDSILTQSYNLLSDPLPFELEDSKFIVARGHHGSYSELGEDTYTYDNWMDIRNHEVNFSMWGPEGSSNIPLVAGDILPNSPGIEILEWNNHEDLIMYGFNPPNTLTLIWNIIPDAFLQDCIFMSDHPGYFFAFDNDRFIQFNGEDGTEFQSTTHIPAGIKLWEYPFDDGQPYLVTLNANVVSIYKPVIITDADGGEAAPLPVSLSLGKPYPNPFNSTQTIPVTAKPGKLLTIDVFNLLGQKVDCIYSGINYSQEFKITWNADKFASGIYLIRAVSEDETAVVRSILLK